MLFNPNSLGLEQGKGETPIVRHSNRTINLSRQT